MLLHLSAIIKDYHPKFAFFYRRSMWNYVRFLFLIGSSFTKAKPQHGFLKVARLATLRFIFLPFYSRWWIKQTSRTVFLFILSLYIAQLINIIVYYIYTAHSTTEVSANRPPNHSNTNSTLFSSFHHAWRSLSR